MFKLLKKKKTEQEVLLEIHNEFDTAEDRLLDEADKLLLELNIPTESNIEVKADKLKQLGFINSEVVKQANELTKNRLNQQEKLVQTRDQAELIRYYKQTYPFQKFLTEKELERICEKYKLVFAPVANYVKDVPEKNIKEIESCTNLKQIDVLKQQYEINEVDNLSEFNKMLDFLGKKDGIFTNEEVKDLTLEYRGARVDEWCFGNKNGHMLFYDLKRKMDFKFRINRYSTINKKGLFIAAPPSHFNLKGLTKKGKYSFLNIIETEVKDPIVFRYCKGGIQVLSKWGLEASEELLVNEQLN